MCWFFKSPKWNQTLFGFFFPLRKAPFKVEFEFYYLYWCISVYSVFRFLGWGWLGEKSSTILLSSFIVEVHIFVNCISCVTMLLQNSHLFILKNSYSFFEHLSTVYHVKTLTWISPSGNTCRLLTQIAESKYLIYFWALEIGHSNEKSPDSPWTIWSD